MLPTEADNREGDEEEGGLELETPGGDGMNVFGEPGGNEAEGRLNALAVGLGQEGTVGRMGSLAVRSAVGDQPEAAGFRFGHCVLKAVVGVGLVSVERRAIRKIDRHALHGRNVSHTPWLDGELSRTAGHINDDVESQAIEEASLAGQIPAVALAPEPPRAADADVVTGRDRVAVDHEQLFAVGALTVRYDAMQQPLPESLGDLMQPAVQPALAEHSSDVAVVGHEAPASLDVSTEEPGRDQGGRHDFSRTHPPLGVFPHPDIFQKVVTGAEDPDNVLLHGCLLASLTWLAPFSLAIWQPCSFWPRWQLGLRIL